MLQVGSVWFVMSGLVFSPVIPPSPQDIRQKLDDYFTRAEAYGFSGAILVARQGEILFHNGLGLADRRNRIRNTEETAFGIASLDKQFTAAAILILEQDKKLSTDDPIAKYLPDIPDDKSGVTIHQLLSHTSGLGNFYRDEFSGQMFDAYLRTVLKKPLRSKPGEKFEYSNSGYDLLVHLIEVMTRVRYEDFLAKRFFEPMGMSSSGFRRLELPADRIAKYEDNPDWSPEIPWAAADPVHPFLSLRSTVEDLFRWHNALSQDAILNAASKAKLFTANLGDYACGWNVGRTSRNTKVIHHGGYDTGCGLLAGFYRYPDEDLVIIFFANTLADRTLVGELVASTIEDLVFGKPVVFPPPPSPIDSKLLQRWVGTYELESGGKIAIELAGGAMTATATEPNVIALLRFPESGGSGLAWGTDEKLRDAVAAIDTGDLAPLSALLFETTNAAAFMQEAKALWADYRNRWGAFRGLKLLHRLETVFEGQPETQLIFQVDFERGHELLRGFRNPAGCYHVSPYRTENQKIVLSLVPQSPADFSTWNFRMQTGTPFHFVESTAKAEVKLEIRSTNGATVANKR